MRPHRLARPSRPWNCSWWAPLPVWMTWPTICRSPGGSGRYLPGRRGQTSTSCCSVGESVNAVSEVRQRHPGTVVVAAVAQDAAAGTVISILQAGAAACVRISGQHDSAVLVAAHLRLCSRYRTSGRAADHRGG